MTPEQRTEFDTHGVVRLAGALAPAEIAAVRDRVWERAERVLDIDRAVPETWRRVPPKIMRGNGAPAGIFAGILNHRVNTAIDLLLGPGTWDSPVDPGQLLMTPPDSDVWNVPHSMWHTDFPAPAWEPAAVPGVQLFVLLQDLPSRGGATLIVGGSHRLIQRLPERRSPDFAGHSAELRKALAQQVPWLRALWTRTGHPQERVEQFVETEAVHDGVPLRVIETSGRAGDLYAMHPWSIHASSPNCGGQMRMVATERIVSRAAHLYTFNRPSALEGV